MIYLDLVDGMVSLCPNDASFQSLKKIICKVRFQRLRLKLLSFPSMCLFRYTQEHRDELGHEASRVIITKARYISKTT